MDVRLGTWDLRLETWGVLGGYFTEGRVEEALGDGGVGVGDEGGAAEVVGVVVEDVVGLIRFRAVT